MPSTEKRFIRFDRWNGWRVGQLDGLALTGDQAELRLRTKPGTGRPLFDPDGDVGDGDFGGMTLPTGLAEDGEGRVYILDARQCRLRRFDPCLGKFETLPCIAGEGSEPRQVQSPHGIAISPRGDLFVADTGNRRVQVFNLEHLYLRDLIGPLHLEQVGNLMQAWPAAPRQTIPLPDYRPGRPHAQPDCLPCLTFPEGTWEPWGIAVSQSCWIYVTDRANNRIHRFNPAGEWAGFVWQEQPGVPLYHPTHLAIDRRGYLYIIQEERDYVLVLKDSGEFYGKVVGPEELEGLFDPAAVAIDQNDHLCVSDRGTRALYWYDSCAASNLPVYTGQTELGASWAGALVFGRSGEALALDAQCHKVTCIPAVALLETEGIFYSQALDSRIYRCSWHRVTLKVSIPQGAKVKVDTFTSEAPKETGEIHNLEEARWETGQVLAQVEDKVQQLTCLVQSPPGRYLWLRLSLTGNGLTGPAVSEMRVDFPRVTPLDYLPAVFREDPQSAHFLEEFLSITETVSEPVGAQIDRMAGLFDPMVAPVGTAVGARRGMEIDFLAWLGSWLGLTIERHWPEQRRRMLIAKAHRLFQLRGTAEGLRLHLSIYTGLPIEDIQILEHYQLRRWTELDGSPLGDSEVWGKQIVNRLQIGENSQVGGFQLIDTQDPLRDPFYVYAHQFTVFLPWQPRQPDETDQTARDTVRRIVEWNKPAHTQATIRFMTPRFVIGEASIIGLDTILGEPPAPQPVEKSELGYTAVLAPAPDPERPPVVEIGKNTQLGMPMRLD
jgi:phage tail-like protein